MESRRSLPSESRRNTAWSQPRIPTGRVGLAPDPQAAAGDQLQEHLLVGGAGEPAVRERHRHLLHAALALAALDGARAAHVAHAAAGRPRGCPGCGGARAAFAARVRPLPAAARDTALRAEAAACCSPATAFPGGSGGGGAGRRRPRRLGARERRPVRAPLLVPRVEERAERLAAARRRACPARGRGRAPPAAAAPCPSGSAGRRPRTRAGGRAARACWARGRRGSRTGAEAERVGVAADGDAEEPGDLARDRAHRHQRRRTSSATRGRRGRW